MLDVLAGAAPLSRALAKDARSNTLILASARRARDPAQMLASASMAQLMAHLRQTCDLVIVDAAPLLTANDSRFVLPYADAVVMVVRWDGRARPSVNSAIGALGAMRSPPVGIVLAY
jgi:Mrp family chromosome partitioning ATPase